jgi:hypothetical protein
MFITSPARRSSGWRAITVAQNYGLSPARLATALRLLQEHEDEIRAAWQTHFGS